MKRTATLGIIGFACLLACVWKGESAVTNYVDGGRTGQGGANSGVSWADAYTNLQEALAIVSSGTDLWLAQGVYYPTNVSTPTSVTNSCFLLKTGMTIYGGFTNGMSSLAERDWMEYSTILSGDLDRNGILDTNNSRFVVWMGTNTAVDGCHIMHGYSKEIAYRNVGCAVSTYSTAGTYLSTNYVLRNCVIAHNAAYGAGGNPGTVVGSLMAPGRGLISNCVFMANICFTPANVTNCNVIMGNYGNTLSVKNCLFLWNRTGNAIYKAGANFGLDIDGCTFARNYGYQVYSVNTLTWTIKNSILWGNGNSLAANSSSSRGTASYCDIQGSGGSTAWTLGATNITDGAGNIDADPLFVGGPSGTWSATSVYNSAAFRTTLTDGSAAFGNLRGKYLVTMKTIMTNNCFYILSNSATQIVVLGKADTLGTAGTAYEVLDAHEMPNSPCIDAGNPTDSYAMEPQPNGKRINMGAYGNTPQAACRASAGMLMYVH